MRRVILIAMLLLSPCLASAQVRSPFKKVGTVITPAVPGDVLRMPSGDIRIRSSGAAFDLKLTLAEAITADRALTLSVVDAARTVTISGNAVISQDYSTAGSPQFNGLVVGASGIEVTDDGFGSGLSITGPAGTEARITSTATGTSETRLLFINQNELWAVGVGNADGYPGFSVRDLSTGNVLLSCEAGDLVEIGNTSSPSVRVYGTPSFSDGTDSTKKLTLNLSGITTATTRTVTLPDANITFSTFATTLLDDANASAVRTTIELDSDDVVVHGQIGLGCVPANSLTLLEAQADGFQPVLSLSNFSENANGGVWAMRHARGSVASPAVVQDGDRLGTITSYGWSAAANNWVASGQFRAVVDGIPDSGGDTTDMPGRWEWMATPDGAATPALAMSITAARNFLLGSAGTTPSGLVGGFAFCHSGATPPAIGAATADVISLNGVDNGAGNRELQIQPEAGGIFAIGNDHVRRVPSANHYTENGLVRNTTTTGTQTTIHTVPIPTGAVVSVTSHFIGVRTGGTAGTAGDHCHYWIKGVYQNIAGTVTCVSPGGVPVVLTTAVESQAGFDGTQTISGTNVLERVTGATDNNMSWSVDSYIHVLAG